MNNKDTREKAIERYLNGVNLLIRSTRAWQREKPGFLNGSRDTKSMGKTGQKIIPR